MCKTMLPIAEAHLLKCHKGRLLNNNFLVQYVPATAGEVWATHIEANEVIR